MADPKKKDASASAETASESRPEGESAELIALRARAERAERELTEARDGNRAMRAQFDAAWAEREAELIALRERVERDALPEGAPVRGRMVRFARHTIHCSDDKGHPLTIGHGKPIPEGAQLDGVGDDAIGEREER